MGACNDLDRPCFDDARCDCRLYHPRSRIDGAAFPLAVRAAFSPFGRAEALGEQADATAVAAPDFMIEVQQEQLVREAVAKLKPRCAEMIRLLFYQHPPLPYNEVARRLGLATGSIGFIRGRCLKQLEKILQESGF